MNKNYNLIYIFADQLRYSSLGCNGDEIAITPNIDAFAKAGTNMINACSSHPLGSPYRASLFTGKYSVSTHMVMDSLHMKPCHDTFAEILDSSGYDVDFIGKWHLYSNKKENGENVRNSFVPEGEDRLGFNGYFSAYDNHSRYYAPEAYFHLNSPFKMFYKGFEPDHQTELAQDRIKYHAERKENFALFLSYATPHGDWDKNNVPADYYKLFENTVFPRPANFSENGDERGDYLSKLSSKDIPMIDEWKRCYYAMIANLDVNFGKVLKTVKDCKLEKDTIIVFTSDHGEMFGAHGRKGKNIFYDESVRVPFIIAGKKIKKSVNKTPINTVDIMPTLLSVMGIDSDVTTEGKNLSEEIITGKETKNPCLLMGMGPGNVWGNNREWRGIRTEQFTYSVYLSDGFEFMFDNLNDPMQMNNLADNVEFKDIKLELKATMYQKMAAINDSFQKNSYYKHKVIKNRIIL